MIQFQFMPVNIYSTWQALNIEMDNNSPHFELERH